MCRPAERPNARRDWDNVAPMFGLLSFLAYDRESLMVAALAALVVAGAVVAIGAWLLFSKERRRVAGSKPGEEQPAAGHGREAETPDAVRNDAEP